MFNESRWQLARAQSSPAYRNQLSRLQLQGQRGAGLFLAFQGLLSKDLRCVYVVVCAGAFREPRVQARVGGAQKKWIYLVDQAPWWGRDCSGSCPSPVPFSKSQKSEAGRKLPTAKRSEQMLSAHSRKLGAQRPAAHSLSYWGPPLALTPALWPGLGVGQEVPTADARTEDKPEDSNCDHVSALSQVLLCFRRQR